MNIILTEKHIQEFIDAYQTEFNESIDYETAYEYAQKTIDLFFLVATSLNQRRP